MKETEWERGGENFLAEETVQRPWGREDKGIPGVAGMGVR